MVYRLEQHVFDKDDKPPVIIVVASSVTEARKLAADQTNCHNWIDFASCEEVDLNNKGVLCHDKACFCCDD